MFSKIIMLPVESDAAQPADSIKHVLIHSLMEGYFCKKKQRNKSGREARSCYVVRSATTNLQNFTCSYYTHCSVNLKKNLPNQKGEEPGAWFITTCHALQPGFAKVCKETSVFKKFANK